MIYRDTFATIHRRAMAAALTMPAVLLTIQPSGSVPSYDGVWSVVIVTQSGVCDTYRYPIRISNGHVQNAGNSTVQITGKIGKNGTLTVNVSAGDKTATGTGRLTGRTGSGSWTGGNGACTGIWQAERRS